MSADFWTEWNNIQIPNSVSQHLQYDQDKYINGWVWLAPCGSGKTHVAFEWLRRWSQWAGVSYEKNVLYVNFPSIQSWDAWLEQFDYFIQQKRSTEFQGKYHSWVCFDSTERLLPNQQWDLLDKLREKNMNHIGVLWLTASIHCWMPEFLSGCRIWSWFDILLSDIGKQEWIKKHGIMTKIWDYNSLNYLIVKEEQQNNYEYESIHSICKKAWKSIVNKDYREWVSCGYNNDLFRIPWNDLIDTIKAVIEESGGLPNYHNVHERVKQWWNEGIRLTPLFPRIDCAWHHWNLWGQTGIRLLHNTKNFDKVEILPHMGIQEADPRVWLNDCWNKETPEMGNLIIWGPPGGGKTSFIESWIHKWYGSPPDKRWVYYRNSSLEKWSKLFRQELEPFLTTDPLRWGSPPNKNIPWRWIVLDEVDQMSLDAQDFLRSQINYVQNEKIPVYFLLIANERSRLNWALTAKFQIIHWSTPRPEWLQQIFPENTEQQPYEPQEDSKSIYHWWAGYKEQSIKEINVPQRWWREESGDLRRYKMRYTYGILNEKKKKTYWVSRGDIQGEFWKLWIENENIDIPFQYQWEKIPIWFPYQNKEIYIQYLRNNVDESLLPFQTVLPSYANEIYTAWIHRSHFYGILPPNITWVYPVQIQGTRWIRRAWKELKQVFSDKDIALWTIDVADTTKDANWVREILKTKTKLTRNTNCWIILNAHLLDEEAQVSLRRLIDDTREKIIWWFSVCNLYNWMEALRSRAEPLLITPSRTFEIEDTNTSLRKIVNDVM